jgi:hypothetical protein
MLHHHALLHVVSLCICVVSGSQRALWIWDSDDSPLKGAAQSQRFFSWAASQHAPIGTLLLEDEQLAKANDSAFVQVLDMSATHNMQVAALFGWNGAAGGDVPREDVLHFLEAVINVCNHTALAGVSFDIEPRNSHPQAYQQYADLLLEVCSYSYSSVFVRS